MNAAEPSDADKPFIPLLSARSQAKNFNALLPHHNPAWTSGQRNITSRKAGQVNRFLAGCAVGRFFGCSVQRLGGCSVGQFFGCSVGRSAGPGHTQPQPGQPNNRRTAQPPNRRSFPDQPLQPSELQLELVGGLGDLVGVVYHPGGQEHNQFGALFADGLGAEGHSQNRDTMEHRNA